MFCRLPVPTTSSIDEDDCGQEEDDCGQEEDELGAKRLGTLLLVELLWLGKADGIDRVDVAGAGAPGLAST